MKKVFKIISKIVLFICLIFLVQAVFHDIKSLNLRKYNRRFISEYLSKYSDDEVLSCKKEIYIPSIIGIDGGSYKEVDTDEPNKNYHEIYIMRYVYDDLSYEYTIEFGHSKLDKIQVIKDTREELVNNIAYYQQNFELIKNIVEANNSKVENIGLFNNKLNIYNQSTYFLLIYVEDTTKMYNLVDELYDKVYGGYVEDRQNKLVGGDVTMPRFIFTNSLDYYEIMCNNLNNAKDFLFKYDYECYETATDTTSSFGFFTFIFLNNSTLSFRIIKSFSPTT